DRTRTYRTYRYSDSSFEIVITHGGHIVKQLVKLNGAYCFASSKSIYSELPGFLCVENLWDLLLKLQG
ncbi:MAG: hypothetical protein ACRD42_03155, partial [Nitrososphaeraceae archaeon]